MIHPYAQQLRNGLPNAKTPPVGWWPAILSGLDEPIVQIGVKGQEPLVPECQFDRPFRDIERLVDRCSYWIAIDSFLPHLASHRQKPGVVIWSVSDPAIFGYPENLNLLKNRSFLRAQQFAVWEDQRHDPETFLDPMSALAQIRAWRPVLECV